MKSRFLIAMSALAGLFAARADAATLVWTGGGGDGNLATAANWNGGMAPAAGDSLSFPASLSGILTQNIDALTIASLAFTGGGSGAFTLKPGAQTTTVVTLASGLSTVAGIGRDSVAFPLKLGAAQTWTLATAMSLTGAIDNNGFLLTLNSQDAGNPTHLAGVMQGAGGLTLGGTGTVVFLGNAANTYSGNTTVNNGGTLMLATPDNVVAVPGTLTTNDSTVSWLHDEMIGDAATVHVFGSTGGLLLNGHTETIGTLDLVGTLDLAATGVLTLANSADMTLGGKIVGGASTKIIWNGGASRFLQMSLNGINWIGTLVVGAGTLQSAQNAKFGIVLGQAGAFARAILIGTYGAISVSPNATLMAGTFSVPGVVDSGDLTFASGSTYQARLGGTAAGSLGSDRVNVTGTVSLGGATLQVDTSYTPSLGDVITLIQNDGSDAVVGTFAGKPEGAIFFVSGFSSGYWQLSYQGGDGNDVTLTKVAMPPDMAMPRDMSPIPDLAGAAVDLATDDSSVPVDDGGGVVFDLSEVRDLSGEARDLSATEQPDGATMPGATPSGCGCTVGGAPSASAWWIAFAALALSAVVARRLARRARARGNV